MNKRIPLEDRLPYIKRLIDAHFGSSAPVSLNNPDVGCRNVRHLCSILVPVAHSLRIYQGQDSSKRPNPFTGLLRS